MGILKERAKDLDVHIGTGADLLSKQLEELTIAVEDQTLRTFKIRVEELFEAIKQGTPVDTGHARRNWQMRIEQRKHSITTTIWNGVEYIVWLEVGASKQAPTGMVRVNLRKMNQKLLQDIVSITGRPPRGV